jgi:hypothetical protein
MEHGCALLSIDDLISDNKWLCLNGGAKDASQDVYHARLSREPSLR